MAKRIRNHLMYTYPGSYWVVTVYKPVYGFDKHTVYSYNYFYKFRYGGVNIVVTRLPSYGLRSPSPSISTVMGSISGESNAKAVVEIIEGRFKAHGETYTTIRAVRRSSSGVAIAAYIPPKNYIVRMFTKKNFFFKISEVVVIVVAPRYF